MNSRVFSKTLVGAVAIVFCLTGAALAGPPLICHRIEIGHAKTLPLIDWNQKETGNYNLHNLTGDTLAILDPRASVLVRMETLRLATIYARHDPQVAKELLTRLHARAYGSSGQPDPLVWFDLGYLAEAYAQWMPQHSNPAAGLNGYALVKKAISLRGHDDPEMEFAAALITLSGPAVEHKEHLSKSLAGVSNDPLLAQNLASRFPAQSASRAFNSKRDN